MSKYRDRELQELPAGWKWTTVDEITEVIRGASPRPKGDPRYFGGTIPWIMIADVTRQPGKYLHDTREGVTEAGAALSRRIPAGDLILSNSATVCVPKILQVEGCIHDGFVSFPSLKNHVDLLFAYYWFECVRPTVIQENRQGVTQVNLNTSIVGEIHFPLAPLAEQRRIVAKIEELFSELDKGIENLKQARAQLTVYRQALLKHAFEGKLTADWRKANAGKLESADQLLARIKAERRKSWKGKGKYPEPLDVDPVGLPDIPRGWAWVRIDVLGRVGSGVSVSKDRQVTTPIEVPYLRVANVQRGHLDLTEIKTMKVERDDLEDLRLGESDVLFNEGGDRDKLGRGWVWEGQLDPCITQNHVFRVTPVSRDLIDSRFVSHWGNTFGQHFFEAHGKQTTNLASINKANLSSLPVPLPDFSEQAEIVARLEEQLTVAGALQNDIDTNLQKAEALRQSILKKAFAGELVPQDPNDEPAATLLARIRKEKDEGRKIKAKVDRPHRSKS
jgi:type I restriction enzyme, S subunit